MKKFFLLYLTLFVSSLLFCASAQDVSPIKVNQVGYYPNGEKIAVIEKVAKSKKYTLSNMNGKVVWKGKAVRKAVSPWSDKEREIIDFSSVTTPGKYLLSNGKSVHMIVIKDKALEQLSIAGMKAFYLQRMSIPVLECHAGNYNRPAAHPDTVVYVHPSASSADRPAGTVISSPGGWYDAGDYNKYVVNSSFAVCLMLSAYEMNKEYFAGMRLNIPESDNATPDFLDEIMYNISWMQTMQDPADGGVYHKLTTPNFEGFVMPVDCSQKRYVMKKTTSAALDFAATLAKASRLYGEYEEYKDFAAVALQQAKAAYRWAVAHPDVFYEQSEINKLYEPKVNTGTYDDTNFDDEFFWAATELFFATNDMSYLQMVQNKMKHSFVVPTWDKVQGLGFYTWIAQSLVRADMHHGLLLEEIKPLLISFSDRLLSTVATSCYNTPYGNVEKDFHWGCLAESCCGQAIAMLYSYRITGQEKYLRGAVENMDYILGRNATGYCYVTGFGDMSPMHPHQRLSEADGIVDPQPGLLVGGPNPGQQDKNPNLTYPSDYADESYVDDVASYASNEIAINWNASLVALSGWIEAINGL